MHIADIKVPQTWTKLVDLIDLGRDKFEIKDKTTYYIHNNSAYILYVAEAFGYPTDEVKEFRVYAGRSAGYVKSGGDLYVRAQLPDVYPFPETISITFCDDVVAEDAIALGNYTGEARCSGAYVFRGSVPNKEALPADASVGDVYNSEDNGMNYAWTGSEWDQLGGSFHVDLSPLATKEEVNAQLAEKADKSALELLATKEEVAFKASKEEVTEQLTAKAEATDVVALEGEVDAIKEEMAHVVSYTDFTHNGQERKTIQLNNYDNISGIDTKGVGHNLAMVSKWDVADFGAAGLHCNLNTADTVTINDNKVVATADQLEPLATKEELAKAIESVDHSTFATKAEVSLKADKTELEPLATKAEVAAAIASVDHSTFATKEELQKHAEQNEEDFRSVDDTLKSIDTAFRSMTEALGTKAEQEAVDEAVKDVVKYQDFVRNGEERKTIQLANYDNISGIATDGTGHNLAMVSKWDVADFGAPGLHCNLNTMDTVTINDNKIVATLEDLEPLASVAFVNEVAEIKANKTELEPLATREELATAIATADFATKEELANAIESVDHSTFATKEELAEKADTVEVYNALDTKAAKAEVDQLKEKAVEFTDFVYNNEERKTIQLANYDNISGVDTKGTGHNLAMISKWDVADFGATGVHCNLNTLDTVTINDDKVVATLDDVQSAVSSIDTTNFATTEAVAEVRAVADSAVHVIPFIHNGEERGTIQLANFDTISGIGTDGKGYNLAMISKWNVADFGSTGVHCNLNTLDTVTINDDKVVATTDLIEALEARIAALEAKIEQLENAGS